MLYRHVNFEETMVHQCADADKYTTARRQEMANVRKHDITGYLSIPVRDYDHPIKPKGKNSTLANTYPVIRHETVHIDFCPFCGVNLDKDEQTGEFLDLKLL